MSARLTQEFEFHVDRDRRGRIRMQSGPGKALSAPKGRVPRVSKLMALAIRLDGLVRTGQVDSYVELAKLGHVTPARITQIMNLVNLAPDIQEALLHLPLVESGRDPLKLRDLQPIAGIVEWKKQRAAWKRIAAMLRFSV